MLLLLLLFSKDWDLTLLLVFVNSVVLLLLDVNNVSLPGEPGDRVLLLELTILLHEDDVVVAVADVVDFGLDSRKMPSIPLLLDCDDGGGIPPLFGLLNSLPSSTALTPKCVLLP